MRTRISTECRETFSIKQLRRRRARQEQRTRTRAHATNNGLSKSKTAYQLLLFHRSNKDGSSS